MGEKLFHTWEIPRSGSKAEDGEKKREREREKERKLVITMAKLCMAHASTHGARKPPGPKERLNDGDNNGQATHGASKHAWRTQAAWANRKGVSPVQLGTILWGFNDS